MFSMSLRTALLRFEVFGHWQWSLLSKYDTQNCPSLRTCKTKVGLSSPGNLTDSELSVQKVYWDALRMVAQMVKCLSTMWETWVRSLGWEDSLEKEMVTHSSTLALKIPWTEELGAGYYPWGRKESAQLSDFTFTFRLTADGGRKEAGLGRHRC